MNLEIYLLSLLTAVMWGIMQAFYKRGLAAGGNPLQSSLTVIGINLIIFWILLLVIPNQEGGMDNLSLRAIFVFSLGGIFGTALGRWINAVGIDRVGATINSATSSARPLFTAIIAVVWLGETGDFLLYWGILILVLGIVILTFSKGGNIHGWQPRDLWIPLAGAAVLAIGNVIRRFGLMTTSTTILEALTINQTAAFLVLLGFTLTNRRYNLLRAPRITYLFFVTAGIFGAIALISLFAALENGPVAVVDPLVGTQPLFTTALAYFLLGDLERITWKLIGGVLLVIVGASMIMLSDVNSAFSIP